MIKVKKIKQRKKGEKQSMVVSCPFCVYPNRIPEKYFMSDIVIKGGDEDLEEEKELIKE